MIVPDVIDSSRGGHPERRHFHRKSTFTRFFDTVRNSSAGRVYINATARNFSIEIESEGDTTRFHICVPAFGALFCPSSIKFGGSHSTRLCVCVCICVCLHLCLHSGSLSVAHSSSLFAFTEHVLALQLPLRHANRRCNVTSVAGAVGVSVIFHHWKSEKMEYARRK
jgi:hypothetical protein